MTIWNINKIQEYIQNGIEENIHLDYKRIASLARSSDCINELSKDVSSFANSDGGVIIYGVIEEGHKPTALDKSPIPTGITKEWIENIINSNISPIIPGVVITPIDYPEHHNQLFVLSIPRSTRSPHMAKDNRYYKRYNFKSQAMEHYEIEDVRRRISSPDLAVIPIDIKINRLCAEISG